VSSGKLGDLGLGQPESARAADGPRAGHGGLVEQPVSASAAAEREDQTRALVAAQRLDRNPGAA
jgi:hypothetical protein